VKEFSSDSLRREDERSSNGRELEGGRQRLGHIKTTKSRPGMSRRRVWARERSGEEARSESL
jgi:hypothetical protein